MSDPIAERMTPDDRAEWERLRAEGFALLAQAHEVYMKAANERKGK